MKPIVETFPSFACDDLPLPVIIYRRKDGRVIKYNTEARRVFELPVKGTRSLNINKLRVDRILKPVNSKSKSYIDFGPITHYTLKGKEVLFTVLRKVMRWQNEDFYVDFFKDTCEAAAVKNEIISSALDAFISIDEDQNILDWNASAEKIFGWKKREVVGVKWTSIVSEQFRKKCGKDFKLFLKTGRGLMLNQVSEMTAIHKKGYEFPIELVVTISKEHGKKIGYSFIRDISDRKNLMRSLRESEDNVKKAQSLTAMGSWEMFGNFNELHWSDEFYRIHGLEPQSVKPSTRLRLSMVHHSTPLRRRSYPGRE